MRVTGSTSSLNSNIARLHVNDLILTSGDLASDLHKIFKLGSFEAKLIAVRRI